MTKIKELYDSFDSSKPEEFEKKKIILNSIKISEDEDGTVALEEKEDTEDVTQQMETNQPFITKAISTVDKTTKDTVQEKQEKQEGFKTTGSTQNKENPDNMVSVERLTKKAVDKLLNPTAEEKRRTNAGFYSFLTPDDQNGGIGTAETNPFIRQNEAHEDKMAKGNLSSYYDNTLWGNNNNLLFKKTYNIPEIKREMKQRKEYPKKVRGLIRKYPAYMPPQIQQRKEMQDFQPAINPSSNYYKGSRYSGYYRSIAAPLPYDEYVKRFYANPNYFTAGADFY